MGCDNTLMIDYFEVLNIQLVLGKEMQKDSYKRHMLIHEGMSQNGSKPPPVEMPCPYCGMYIFISIILILIM